MLTLCRALRDIAASRNEICAPNMQLVELDDIQTLKQKITSLIKLVRCLDHLITFM